MVRVAIGLGLGVVATLAAVSVVAGCEGSCEDKLNCGPQVVADGGGPGSGGQGGIGGSPGGVPAVGGSGGTGGAEGGGGSGGMPPVATASEISAGAQHTCALLTDGGVRCWGDNARGQLGDGTTLPSPTPVAVVASDDATVVVAGYGNACDITSTGTARCWGANDQGQIAGQSGNDSSSPLAVGGIPGAIANIANGENHACSHTGGGAVYCWGSNFSGQLGVPGPGGGPKLVTSLSNIDLTGAGLAHTCARSPSGLFCWGQNDDGQVGVGSGSPVISSPTEVTIASVTSVCGGGGFSCATVSGGGVRCWGAISVAGAGAIDYGNAPVVVAGATQATAITCGGDHACIVDTGKSVWCWGNNEFGELGFDGAGTSTPTMLQGLAGVEHIAAGEDHTCAILDDGSVRCWGRNTDGQLGNGTFDSSSVPVEVAL